MEVKEIREFFRLYLGDWLEKISGDILYPGQSARRRLQLIQTRTAMPQSHRILESDRWRTDMCVSNFISAKDIRD